MIKSIRLIATVIFAAVVTFFLTCYYRFDSAAGINFRILKEGSFILRNLEDHTYSAVIFDKKALHDILKEYPQVDLVAPDDLFENEWIVIGFSDSCLAVTTDGFKRKKPKKQGYYYLDLFDLGVEFKLAKPPPGQKRSGYCAIAIPKQESIAHIQVREGAIGGLYRRFGEP
jgi:hypothetical protein